jgi:diguanylate cyclase (GGDEF)-like protein/PAS domain S-box-containing protein
VDLPRRIDYDDRQVVNLGRDLSPTRFLVISLTACSVCVLVVVLGVRTGPFANYVQLCAVAALILLLITLGVSVYRAYRGRKTSRLNGARARALINAMPVPASAADRQGRIVAVNHAYCALLGHDPQQLKDLSALVHPDDLEFSLQLFRELMSGRRTRYRVTRRALAQDGRIIRVEADAFRVDSFQVEFVEDITARELRDEALRSDEARQATENAVTGVLVGADSLDDAIPRLLQAMCEYGRWQVGVFWMQDARTKALRCGHFWCPSHVLVPQFEAATRSLSLQPGEGLSGRVWESGEPAWTADIGTDDTIFRGLKAEAEGLRSAFSFPIVFESQILGVIELVSSEVRPRDDLISPAIRAINGLFGRFFERERAEERLRVSEERYRTITEIAHDAVITIDQSGTMLSVNGAAERLFGFAREEMVGHALTMLIPEKLRNRHRRAMERYRGSGKRRIRWDAIELPGLRKDGSEILLEISLAEFIQAGTPTFTGYLRDITERKEEESALVYQALHDALTDLPNRTLLSERLEQAILVGHRHNTPVSLMMMDLDRFKEVNDTFGHHSGDVLLQQVSQRLVANMRQSDTIARLGGDEFAVLLPQTDAVGAIDAARRLVEALRQPFTLEDRQLDVGISMGIAAYPVHGSDAATLMRRADSAMYAAKRGSDDFSVYSPERDENNSARLLMTGELRHAIEANELVLHYQPKVGLVDGSIRNVEALVRWIHPERGFTPPDTFIPLAEETGLIKPLTIWVLNEALRQHRAWRVNDVDIRMAVNFSARMLHDPDLVRTIAELLQRWKVEPSRLLIEITESAIMLDPESAMTTLTHLHNAGVWTAIDDFGTGYSSLGYLRKLPVDEIKIDKSFVLEMATNRDDASIVELIVNLGHNLGLKVVAEGVDNQRTLTMLTEMGCDLAQGFFLSRPVPALELTAMLGGPDARLSFVS